MNLSPAPQAPGLRVFTLCLSASILLLTLFPDSQRLLGLLVLFWSFFCLLRALWIMETTLLPATIEKQRRSRILPWIILSEKNLRQRLDSGLAARYAGNIGLILFFLSGTGFSGWALYLHLFPAVPEDFAILLKRIGIFLNASASDPARPVSGWTGFFLNFAEILWIGLMVWTCRSYACAPQNAALLLKALVFCLTLSLGACLITGGLATIPFSQPLPWAGSGWGAFPAMETAGFFPPGEISSFAARATELGIRGMALSFIPGLAVFLSILGNTGRSERRKKYALATIGALLLMMLSDMLLVESPRTFPVWLSFWSLIATLWGCASAPRANHGHNL